MAGLLRRSFCLRSVTPGETSALATRHQMWSCFCNLLTQPRERARVVKDGSNVAYGLGRFGLQQRGTCGPLGKDRVNTHTVQGVVSSMKSLHTIGFRVDLGR